MGTEKGSATLLAVVCKMKRTGDESGRKWGKIGPSHLLSENSDLSFLLFFFSKQCLVENIQGKLKKFIGNFYFCGITFFIALRIPTAHDLRVISARK